ncbi:MAG: HAD family acid phosphatase [bacterium]|nr:HAD family acid phosphatase [bacterium]
MKQSLKLISRFFLTLICISPFSVFSEPPNLVIVKKEVIKYHDSGVYEQELAKKIGEAKQFLLQQVKLNHGKNQQKLALVLDIDETSLSNYDKMIKRDFTATSAQLHLENLKGDDSAIKPTLALYKEAIKNGIHVFFITGRRQSEKQATEHNLKAQGYTQWTGLYLRPKHYHHKSIVPFKSGTRAMLEKQGYIILATIGDQYSDIKGGYAKKGFKLPNPFYYLP